MQGAVSRARRGKHITAREPRAAGATARLVETPLHPNDLQAGKETLQGAAEGTGSGFAPGEAASVRRGRRRGKSETPPGRCARGARPRRRSTRGFRRTRRWTACPAPVRGAAGADMSAAGCEPRAKGNMTLDFARPACGHAPTASFSRPRPQLRLLPRPRRRLPPLRPRLRPRSPPQPSASRA